MYSSSTSLTDTTPTMRSPSITGKARTLCSEHQALRATATLASGAIVVGFGVIATFTLVLAK